MSQRKLGKNILRESSPVSSEEQRWEEFKRLRAAELAEKRREEEALNRGHVANESMPDIRQPTESRFFGVRIAKDEEDNREES